jgi:RNA polymerase sigma factor (sigma-70 family)
MLSTEEVQWVCKAQAADRDAFSLLVDRYWLRLARWFYSVTARRDVAEDLTQETFLRAWIALPHLQTAGAFRVWLFRIAHNCVLTHIRQTRHEEIGVLPRSMLAPQPSPLASMIDTEGQQLLLAALARLSVNFRLTYQLWTQEELPYSKIAQILSITEATARWRVCKARQFLARELQEFLSFTTT